MNAAAELEHILQTAPALLVETVDPVMAHAGGWSRKQILGHLIDSAANNHQRFVRGQFTQHLEIPGYAQNEWVEAQSYATESWPDLVNLWLLLNRHLLHVIRHMSPECLSHTCSIGGREPVTLGYIVDDYVVHMEHHLAQIFG